MQSQSHIGGPSQATTTKAPTKTVESDIIQNIIGGFGKYQFIICVLLCLCKFLIAFHQMAIIFLAPKVNYKCPGTETMTCPCKNPDFDRSLFKNSIIMEWKLICERKWLTSFTQTVFQLGTLVGSVVFGMVSDRLGRRKPFLFAVLLEVVAGITAAFIPEYWTFTVIRFLVGTAVAGTMVISFVIIMEFVGAEYREAISALYQTPFNLGHMLLPAFGYFFRDYRSFQLAISLPALILFVYFCMVPETPRWLIAMGKVDEATQIIEHVANVNKRPTENIKSEVQAYQAMIQKTQLKKKGNILDLFKTPNLRKNIIAMSLNWLSCSYCFYGVSQYVGQLSGDAFVNVAASASVTLCGTLLSIPLMRIMGRKTLIIISNFVAALCLIILAVLPDGIGTIIFACIGVVASFIVFILVYLYTSEMFPTVVRNAAIGFSSMMARVGSMIAPFIIDLKDVAVWLPPVAFAVLPLTAGFITFILPETKGCELMTTIEEGENFGKKARK